MTDSVLLDLVNMSCYLGDSKRTYVILGEGNTSARIDEDTFYVKASGFNLDSIGPEGFVSVSISKVMTILDDESAGDEEVTRILKEALTNPNETRRPSVETILHAILLSYPGVNFVGHTHPTHTCKVLCSQQAEEMMAGRLCPDHIVVLGNKSLFIPYVDPGLMLAREIRTRVKQYVEEEGNLPRAIFQQGHGVFALGDSPKAVNAITDMTEKMSEIIVGTHAMGGPVFMPPADVERIYTRPDEKYREKVIR